MKKKYLLILVFILSISTFIRCTKSDNSDNYTPILVSNVSVDLTTVPYPKLSDYHFFDGDIKNQSPTLNVLPYQPASSLFTDYALKKRFVWMPKNTKASYNSDGTILNLPVGSALVKTFYYNNVQPSNTTRIIETRIMIRKSSGWIFAEYVWNTEQTEAVLNMAGSYTPISWKHENNVIKSANYRIPSQTECTICHKSNELPTPIGIKPQNLNTQYNYNGTSQNQLAKWIQVGYLENNLPSNITSTIDYNDSSKSLSLRARSYVDVNCAHCHQSNSHCDYRPMRFSFSETANPTNMGVCVPHQDTTIGSGISGIVVPNNSARSMLFYRINTSDESYRMPLLGRSMIHIEGVNLMQQWINSLPPCP